MNKVEVRREIWKITQKKNGAIFKTESLGLIWIPLDKVVGVSYEIAIKYQNQVANEHGGDFLGSVSSSLPFEETTRRVKK